MYRNKNKCAVIPCAGDVTALTRQLAGISSCLHSLANYVLIATSTGLHQARSLDK